VDERELSAAPRRRNRKRDWRGIRYGAPEPTNRSISVGDGYEHDAAATWDSKCSGRIGSDDGILIRDSHASDTTLTAIARAVRVGIIEDDTSHSVRLGDCDVRDSEARYCNKKEFHGETLRSSRHPRQRDAGRPA
jgi:hypothetical protein